MTHSFLLIGKSNMDGRGFIYESVEINADKILALKNSIT